jgi:hypothetical protein
VRHTIGHTLRNIQRSPAIAGALTGAVLAALGALMLAPTPWAATIYLASGALLGVTVLVTGLGARQHGLLLVTFLVAAGAFTIDFHPLPVFRYLLVSDVLFVTAGLVAWLTGSSMRVPVFVTCCLGLYVANGLAAFLRSSDPEGGLYTWLHTAFLAFLYIPLVTTALATRRAYVRYAFAGVIVSAFVQAALVLLAISQGLYWEYGPRIRGALGNASLWIYPVAVLALVAVLLRGRLVARLASLGILAVIIPAVLATRSRSIWIGILVGVPQLMLLLPRRKIAGAVAALGFAACLSAGYILELYPKPILDRITMTFTVRQSIDIIYRFEVVDRLLPLAAESPLVGIGLNESPKHLPRRLVASSVPQIHNPPLHAAVEVGVPGAFGLVALPIAVFLLWRRARLVTADDLGLQRIADWAFVSFTSIYVGVQFTPAMYEHVSYFVIAVLASMVDDPRRFREPTSPAPAAATPAEGIS